MYSEDRMFVWMLAIPFIFILAALGFYAYDNSIRQETIRIVCSADLTVAANAAACERVTR